jgi:hypothetical protein
VGEIGKVLQGELKVGIKGKEWHNLGVILMFETSFPISVQWESYFAL